MNIVELLKSDSVFDKRISHEGRWMVWYEDEWRVYEHVPYARKSNVLYRGDSEEEAVAALVKEE